MTATVPAHTLQTEEKEVKSTPKKRKREEAKKEPKKRKQVC